MGVEWVEPVWDEAEYQRFRSVLTALDTGEVEVIVTPSTKAAEWAQDHGYRIKSEPDPSGGTIYLIFPGDDGI